MPSVALIMTKRAPESYAPLKSTESWKPEMSKPTTVAPRTSRLVGAALTRLRAVPRARVESFIVKERECCFKGDERLVGKRRSSKELKRETVAKIERVKGSEDEARSKDKSIIHSTLINDDEDKPLYMSLVVERAIPSAGRGGCRYLSEWRPKLLVIIFASSTNYLER